MPCTSGTPTRTYIPAGRTIVVRMPSASRCQKWHSAPRHSKSGLSGSTMQPPILTSPRSAAPNNFSSGVPYSIGIIPALHAGHFGFRLRDIELFLLSPVIPKFCSEFDPSAALHRLASHNHAGPRSPTVLPRGCHRTPPSHPDANSAATRGYGYQEHECRKDVQEYRGEAEIRRGRPLDQPRGGRTFSR
jgi:hypothetical protein